MMLDLNGTLVERTQENPLDILSQLFSDDSNIYGLDDILSSIKKQKRMKILKEFTCRPLHWERHTLLYRRSVMHYLISRKAESLSLLMETLTPRDFIIFPA